MTTRRVWSALSLSLAIAVAALPAAAQSPSASSAGALRALDDQLSAINASDKLAFVATLHFPHVRIAGSNVKVYPTAQAYLPELSLKQHGWDYARWTERKVVQDSVEKVHVVATFTRYLANGKAVDSYEGLYVIVLKNGRWGVVARSSYAP
jgi:hypothetical protein